MNNTVADVLRLTKTKLKENCIESWSIDADLLMCKVMGFSRIQLVTKDTQELTLEQLNQLNELICERLTHKPMQYILGKAEFMGLEFEVNEATLIPRADTEILVETVINEIKKNNYKTVLDIGTGSGAIGISVAKYCCDTQVVAVDISNKALQTAKRNAIINNVKNITFIESNLFENIKGSFDVVVSNPPYIEADVIKTLDSQVKDFEPLLALDGGKDGLDFYRIITQNPEYINANGTLAYEIGYNQGLAVSQLLKENGFENIEIIKDLAGLDRVVTGKKIILDKIF